MIENNGKMSQAQEVRSQAFHMATQVTRGYDGNVSVIDIQKTAEEIEAWLWKAESAGGLRTLVRLARAAQRELLHSSEAKSPQEKLARELAEALAQFET
jgi:hypothetical protein